MVTRTRLDVTFIRTLRLFLNSHLGYPSFILILKMLALKTGLFPLQGRRNLVQRLFQKQLALINGSLTTQKAWVTKLIFKYRSQWPRGLRRRSTAARPLRLWVRIPPEAWMFVCCECCVLSDRGLCDGLITRPQKSYRLWHVVVWSINLENEEAKARYRAVENTIKGL